MDSNTKMAFIKNALAKGYKGPIYKALEQAEMESAAQQIKVAQTEQEQAEGLSNQPEGTSMVFPESSGDFNTSNMKYDVDMKKYDQGGNLVKSFDSVPPGIENIPMGDEEGMVLETPSSKKYQTGGFKYQEGGGKKPTASKLDLLEQFKNYDSNGSTTPPVNKGVNANAISSTQGSSYYKNGSPVSNNKVREQTRAKAEATNTHVTQGAADVKEFLTDPVRMGDTLGMTGIPVLSEAGDLLSAGASTYRGNYGDAALSMAGIAAPFVGGSALKLGVKGVNKVRKINGAAKLLDKTGEVASKIKNMGPFKTTINTAPSAGSFDDILRQQDIKLGNSKMPEASHLTDKWVNTGNLDGSLSDNAIDSQLFYGNKYGSAGRSDLDVTMGKTWPWQNPNKALRNDNVAANLSLSHDTEGILRGDLMNTQTTKIKAQPFTEEMMRPLMEKGPASHSIPDIINYQKNVMRNHKANPILSSQLKKIQASTTSSWNPTFNKNFFKEGAIRGLELTNNANRLRKK
jgi:uncharacterized membrane protein (UPF0127 family)